MNRFFLLLICFTLLLGCGAFFGCGTAKNGTGNESSDDNTDQSPVDPSTSSDENDPPKPPVLTLSEGETAYYTVIVSDDADESVSALAAALRSDLSEYADAKFKISSDFVMRNVDPDTVNEYEILVGTTNRSADDGSLAEAGNDGWCVLAVGNRIVVNAQSLPSLTEAVAYFKSALQTEDGKVCFDTALTKVEHKNYELVGTTLRVGSYNIRHGGDVGLDFSVIANDIKALELDVIGFQEIDKCTRRVSGIDSPKAIAEALGYEYYHFTKGIDYQGGEYGTLIVSRYPIEERESIAFPTHKGYEARAMGHVVINVNGAKVDFYNTHLSYEEAFLVEEQFSLVAEALKGKRGFILTGDFNTSKASYFEGIENSYRVNRDKYITFPSSSKYIDNIVLESAWKTVASGMGPTGHSDHRLLWAELCYAAEEN